MHLENTELRNFKGFEKAVGFLLGEELFLIDGKNGPAPESNDLKDESNDAFFEQSVENVWSE